MNITLAVLVCACRGRRDEQTYAVVYLVRNYPICRFLMGQSFPSLGMRLCWIVSGYCILQYRHRGCCPFVGVNRPERLKYVRIALLYLKPLIRQISSLKHTIKPPKLEQSRFILQVSVWPWHVTMILYILQFNVARSIWVSLTLNLQRWICWLSCDWLPLLWLQHEMNS